MNTENVISLPTSDAAIPYFRRVKMTATGIALAGAADKAIGTVLPSDPGTRDGATTAAVQRLANGIHFATTGSATAIAVGAQLEAVADGKLVVKNTGDAVAVALEASAAADNVIRVVNL